MHETHHNHVMTAHLWRACHTCVCCMCAHCMWPQFLHKERNIALAQLAYAQEEAEDLKKSKRWVLE